MNPTIALLSDFGTHDSYVGVMKGVMHAICPEATFIDITHEIQPQNVREAAFSLMNSYQFFPDGTVFVVVVDPGVGSARKPIAVRARNFTFVAPDNGILTYALESIGTPFTTYEITEAAYRLPQVSNTFHGRDIFAPAAAHIARGVGIADLGKHCESIKTLPTPEFIIDGQRITGEVLHIDRFGNVITSIGHLHWMSPKRLTLKPCFGNLRNPIPVYGPESTISIYQQSIEGISPAYHEGIRGELMMLVGSSGFLEVAINQGNAARRLDIGVGERVTLALAEVKSGLLE